MLDHDFLDKWDMGRRIEARLFCFGSDADDDSGGNAAEDIVTMGRGAPAQGGNVSAREEIAMNNLIDEMDMERRMSGVYGMNDSSGDRRLVNRNIENPMTTGFGPPVPSPTNTNLPPDFRSNFQADLEKEFAASNAMLGRPVRINITEGRTPPLGDPYDELPPSPAELFRAQESQRSMGLDQRQAGYDAYQAMLGNAVADAQGNIDSATGLLGMPTRVMNQMFIDGMNTRIGDRNSGAYQSYLNDARLFEPVYNQRGRLTGYRDQFGRLTGTDPISAAAAMGEDDERRVEAEVNPMTDKPRCPDGYVFDEDLQACRLDTSTSVDQAAPPDGEIFFRRTSLDDAPANTPSGFDFDAANTRFVQSYGSRPDFYRSPMSLTGFTRL